jgi:heme-degrading monooxygenase HmoA
MFARIGTWQGTADELERWVIRAREHAKPALEQDEGLAAAYWLVDRESDKALIVTLWESEAAMRGSEQGRLQRQRATAAATNARVTTDRYEVVDSLIP